MAQGTDSSPRRVAADPTPSIAGNSNGIDLGAAAPLVVVSSAVLIGISLVLTALAMAGLAHLLPVVVRAVIVILIALTLPGLPIAALLRLPSNGIFGSVTIAVSLATNIVLAQTNYVAELRQPFLLQFLLLIVSAIAVAFVAREGYRHRDTWNLSSALHAVRQRFAPAVNRLPSVILIAAALALFAIAVSRLDTDAAGVYGLIEALGVDYFLGVVLLGSALAIEYGRAVIDKGMLALSNIVLIIYITMPVTWTDQTSSFVTGYVHRNISNWMLELGTLPPPLDARTSWAGFFSTIAQLMKIGGLQDSDVFVANAPLLFGIILLFPLYAVALSITKSEKTAWLSATIFVLFNWYQQDYFAPQSVAMQFYTTLLAVLLWQLRVSPLPAVSGTRLKRLATTWMRIPGRVPGRDGVWTQALELTLLLMIAAMVVSHQLTPVVTLTALFLFLALGLTRHKLLFPVAVLLFIGWFAYGGYAFWQGHLGQILSDIGGVDQNISSSVTGQLSGDPTHSQMQYLRIAASLLLFGSAALGWLRMPRDNSWFLVGLLGVIPFGLIALQSYGGEVVIRCFLYASPILASLAAMALTPLLAPSTRQWARVGAAASAFSILTVWCVTDRGLNTSFEHTTPEELSIARQLVAQTQPSQIGYWGQGAFYAIRTQFDFSDSCLESAQDLADCTDYSTITYLIETNQDENFLEYRAGVDRQIVHDALKILQSEKGFEMIYQGPDVRVLKRGGAPPLDLGLSR